MPGRPSSQDERIDLSDYFETLFHGPAAHLADRFAFNAGETNGIACSDLTDPGALKRLLDSYAHKRFPDNDLRSAASFWAQWYLGFLIPPLVLLASAAGTEIPADPASVRLVLDGDDQPLRFIFTQTEANAVDAGACAFERSAAFMERHLSPLVFSFAARSGVSAKVFWMSAAVILDYTNDVFLGPGHFDFKSLTQERFLPNGQRNPLFGPYRPSGSEATRTRRICCMRYNLDGIERCPDCPLKPTISGKRKERPGLVGVLEKPTDRIT
ncbi:siderophore-iron reductase FhuF [Roseibium sp.]|uniref:siderophore-iron reductase FhuF n=1 Tax=Roseibium sp. TaxID=1936156 RepID=UPI003A9746D9